MKHFIKLGAIGLCLLLSRSVLAQKKLSDRYRTKQVTTKQAVKRVATQKRLEPYNKARIIKTTYKTSAIGMKIPVVKKIALPPKTIDIRRIVEGDEWGWAWIHKKKTVAQNIEGLKGKTNVHYFKNIRKKTFTSFSNDFDHIVVTDTLYAPASFLNTDNKPRREKRSYIKIIANCIIYESPIKLASVKLRTETDYVFSAGSIFFKTKQNRLQKMKVGSSPPFVVADGKIKLHKDPFAEKEKILVNRLFIEIMRQITIELISEDNAWEKDKLLLEFQKYRYKVSDDILWKDPEYRDLYHELGNDFNSNQESALERVRSINDLTVLVEGKIKDLDKSPFKYYAVPSKATLVPMMDEKTGVSNKLGNLTFREIGDSKLALTMGVKLGYQKELLEKANKELTKYGLTIEKSISKKIIFIDEQPLQIRGQRTGKIIPIDSDMLELKVELQDENLSLIKLLTKRNDVTFDIIFNSYDSRKEFRQKALFEVSDNIIKEIDYENMIGEFNVIETNSITDGVKITSNLSSNLGAEKEGILNYIEVSLEIQFDNGKISYWGPYRMSSASVLGSENSILFVKHSENYSIKVTGKAHYENGTREIKDNFIVTSPFIELEEGIFKDSENN